MTLDTGENTAAPQEDVDCCRQQSCALTAGKAELHLIWRAVRRNCFLLSASMPGRRGAPGVPATACPGPVSPWGPLAFPGRNTPEEGLCVNCCFYALEEKSLQSLYGYIHC